ncbi:MAG TPA: periplasmic heavy metal sensor [Pyrinomonadaceae bacterium]|nr:periplasmic heavy metal sensor [Pyrinomonadaceae bacterium]
MKRWVMKMKNNARAASLASLALILLLSLFVSAQAQNGEPQPPADAPAQPNNNQVEQMLGPLNLSQDQVRRIRMINADLKDERQAANFRLRTAQRALAEAIQSPTPDETLISQRSKEVADAQANTIRLRSLTEARILQVLSPEQRMTLRQMRARNQQMRRNQQMPRGLGRQQNGLTQPNNNRTLTPRQQRKILRPPTKP